MKKVVALIGSFRKDSVHRQIFKQYQSMLNGAFELEEAEFSSIPLFNADNELHKQTQNVCDHIKASDGVLFFTPEYNYSVPGVLKNCIDSLSACRPQPFAGKKASIISASPGPLGSSRMQYDLRKMGIYIDLHFLNKPEIMIGQYQNKMQDGKITDQITLNFLQQHIKAFSEFL